MVRLHVGESMPGTAQRRALTGISIRSSCHGTSVFRAPEPANLKDSPPTTIKDDPTSARRIASPAGDNRRRQYWTRRGRTTVTLALPLPSRCFAAILFFPSAVLQALIQRSPRSRISSKTFLPSSAVPLATPTAEGGTNTARPVLHSVRRTGRCSSGFCSVAGIGEMRLWKTPSRRPTSGRTQRTAIHDHGCDALRRHTAYLRVGQLRGEPSRDMGLKPTVLKLRT